MSGHPVKAYPGAYGFRACRAMFYIVRSYVRRHPEMSNAMDVGVESNGLVCARLKPDGYALYHPGPGKMLADGGFNVLKVLLGGFALYLFEAEKGKTLPAGVVPEEIEWIGRALLNEKTDDKKLKQAIGAVEFERWTNQLDPVETELGIAMTDEYRRISDHYKSIAGEDNQRFAEKVGELTKKYNAELAAIKEAKKARAKWLREQELDALKKKAAECGIDFEKIPASGLMTIDANSGICENWY